MIWLHPKSVSLLGAELTGVRAVSVSRSARQVVEEWSDGGPYAVFADAAEVSVEIVIQREIRGGAPGLTGSPGPGDRGALALTASPSAGGAHEERIAATVVVTSVRHRLHGGEGPTQTIACRAVSADGASAPITGAQEGGA